MKFNAKKLVDQGIGIWTVTIDGNEWENAVKKGKNKVAASIKIDGFREGKAPKEMVEKYLTPVKYLNAAVQSVMAKAWDFAKEQKTDVEPFSSPTPTPTKISEKSCELEFRFDLKPEIEIGEYKGIKSKDLVKEDFKATKEEIETAINQYRERFALEKDKEDGVIAKGDVAVFDFEGFVDGVAFKGGKGLDFRLVIGSNQMIPGFEDELIGKKLGESKINVTFPKDYTPELSEKKAEFVINVKSVKERILPEKDDELAKDLNLPNIKTYKELENSVKEQIITQKTQTSKNAFVNKVIDIIIENSKIQLPKSAINKEIDNLYKEFEARVANEKLTMKEYKKKTGLTDEAIRAELFGDAKRKICSYLVTDKVRNNEKFEPTKEQVEEKYSKLAAQFGIEVDYIKNTILPEVQVREEIIREQLVDFLYENNG